MREIMTITNLCSQQSIVPQWYMTVPYARPDPPIDRAEETKKHQSLKQILHNYYTQSQLMTVIVKVHVYSSDIPKGSADFTLITGTPRCWNSLFHRSHLIYLIIYEPISMLLIISQSINQSDNRFIIMRV